MKMARQWLSRILPARLQRREVLTEEKRRELLATVGDHDPCLRAILDILQATLEAEFVVCIDPGRTDTERLRAVEGLRVSYWNLKFIEEERAAALEWKKQQRNIP